MTNENELPEEFEEGMCGVIFGFEKMDQAEAFAAAVKERFNLEGRVFDGAVGAARYHMSPWQVDVDRPKWFLPKGASDEARDATMQTERQIREMAEEEFGGHFIGT